MIARDQGVDAILGMRMVADRFKFTCHMLISLTTILILAKHSCSGPLSPTLHSTPLYTISQVGSYSSDPDRENCLHALSKKVAIVANIPIFEFREEITKILEMAEIDKGLIDPSTIIDLELIFYDYMAKLRSYYYLVFINYRRIAISDFIIPSRLDLTEERDHCLGECRKAMEAAVPSLGMAESWNFQV